ncbi:low molecular weight protein-tyrosine-phosphatase [Paeniglutamicibacter cryotolerans]|nr:low molecular weight protein-tyrosine-phosphatase [Paeniglutamicibacter cryotolerans]
MTTVCTGNICRSPMAEYMLRTALVDAGIEGVLVDSAGTTDWEVGRPIDPRAGALLRSHGINADGHLARQFEPVWFRGTDLVLALDHEHYLDLLKLQPESTTPGTVRMLRSFDPAVAGAAPAMQGIYDPWYGDEADFRASWQMISAAIPGVLNFVRSELLHSRGH